MAATKYKTSHVSKMANDDLVGLHKEVQAEMNRRLNDMERQVSTLRKMMAGGGEIPVPYRMAGKSGSGSMAQAGSDAGIRWGSKHNTLIAKEVAKGPKTMDQLKAAGKKGEELSVYQAVLKLAKKGGLSRDGDKFSKGPHFPG